jgi:predicted dehydrogenase
VKNSAEPVFPCNVVIMGGGRWARVYIDVMLELLPLSCRVFVYSPRNYDAMVDWIAGRGIGKQVSAISSLPVLPARATNFVVVVNAAADHEKSIDWALSQHAAVLVEKPLTLSSGALRRLIIKAAQCEVYLAAAHVFLFAEYLINFKNKIKTLQEIDYIDIVWADSSVDTRHGEVKSFDPCVRIFEDCLPHVLSILEILEPEESMRLVRMELFKGGAQLDIVLLSTHCRYTVHLIRNGIARRRVIAANGKDESLTLDFSQEPGTIFSRSQIIEAYPDWATSKKPLSRMLEAFFDAAIMGRSDERLGTSVGLRATCLSEEMLPLYHAAQSQWLAQSLLVAEENDQDVRYALREIVLSADSHAMPVSEDELSRLFQDIKSYVKAPSGREQFASQPIDFVKSVLIKSRMN